jgi:hypothetical protein
MEKETILKIILSILSFYLIIFLVFEVVVPLLDWLTNLPFFLNLPESIGAGTLILLLLLFIGFPIGLLFYLNIKIYGYIIGKLNKTKRTHKIK